MFPHTCTIERPQSSTATGTDAYTETLAEPQTVATDVRCYFEDRSTQFVREESGERATNPARVFFANSQDIREGDLVEFDHLDTEFEVRGVNAPNVGSPVDHTEAELERA